jgi:hypothetical protein
MYCPIHIVVSKQNTRGDDETIQAKTIKDETQNSTVMKKLAGFQNSTL